MSVICAEAFYDLVACEDFEILAFLQFKRLLPNELLCNVCKCKCSIILARNSFTFVCKRTVDNIRHKFSRSLNINTWFSQSSLGYRTVLKIIWHIAVNDLITINDLMNYCGISSSIAVDWYQFVREICFNSIHEIKIGGIGKVVEIDESLFGKRKYNRGRSRATQTWIFGGFDRESKKCFLVPVAKRDRHTLLAVIKQYILPGTTIISDCWKAYDCLKFEGYQHLKVNHSLNFKDPETGAHTNGIEGLWAHAKGNIPTAGRKAEHIPLYLAEFQWKKFAAKPNTARFEELLFEIARQHPL